MTQKTVVCPQCKTEKEVFENVSFELDNVFEDIKGKWVVCENCNNAFGVEI